MNETSWWQWVGGLIAVLFGWLGKRLHERVDQIEQHYISRPELAKIISEMRDERRDMHQENRETLDRIHQRVDELWERP